MELRLDHVVIHVSDWERSNAFYRDVLGAELVERDGAPAVTTASGTQQLNVHGPGQDPSPVAPRPAAPGGADLCFVWDGPIEEAARHLERARRGGGGGAGRRATAARGRGTSVYFRDPDGSLLEFISYAMRRATPRSSRGGRRRGGAGADWVIHYRSAALDPDRRSSTTRRTWPRPA